MGNVVGNDSTDCWTSTELTKGRCCNQARTLVQLDFDGCPVALMGPRVLIELTLSIGLVALFCLLRGPAVLRSLKGNMRSSPPEWLAEGAYEKL